jgi:glucose-1-phosphate thymidylyltransferase
LTRDFLNGPMIVCFSDTLIETDFSFLAKEEADGVAWVMPVDDPRRFGVAEVGADGWVTRFIEKPQEMDNNLVLVGCYYFKSAERLMSSIDEQIEKKIELKGEFFLADAITLMLKGGAKVRVQEISTWLDTGTIDATLDTNRILLERGSANQTQSQKCDGYEIIAPSFIHPTAVIKDSVIGPYASIGANSKVSDSRIEESIVEPGCEIQAVALSRSLIGRQAQVQGRGDGQVMQLNVGDHSSVIL